VARPTLLDLTQRILSAMDSDSVNSIGDTVEAEQVADIIRETYLDIVDEYDLHAKHTMFTLTASGTTARPTHMTIPEGYHSIEWINYDTRTSTERKFTKIPWCEPEDFIKMANQLNSTDTNVDLISDPSGIEFNVRNDVPPSAWTSFDNSSIVFNSYDSSVDAFLQTSKTQVYGQVSNDLTIEDDAVIDLPQELYNLLRNQARETCFDLFKDGAPAKVQRMANRARTRAGRIKTTVRVGQELHDRVNFGRKSRI
jgi:hypothetical protein